MKTHINIYYHVLTEKDSTHSIANLCAQLPDNMQARALRYKSSLAAKHFIFGRRLLRDGLQKINSNDNLETISYAENGKPYLPHTKFNISHSGGIVICAFSSKGDLGIDLELHQDIDHQSLQHSFTETEWQQIENNPKQLYQLWCRKEAVLKATNMTLQSLHNIEVDSFSNQINIDGKIWQLQELKYFNSYGAYAAMCSQYPIENIIVEPLYY